MGAWSIDKLVAQYEVAHVENALIDGFPAQTIQGSHQVAALREAADRLNKSHQSLRNRIGTPQRPGSIFNRYGFQVDWSLDRPKPEYVTLPELPKDAIAERRKDDKLADLRQRVKAAERRAAAAEDWRSHVLSLHELPPAPVNFPARDPTAPARETIVVVLSDLHWSEKIDLGAMDGLNSFSVEIARKRLARWAQAVIDLATKHWSGPPPDRIITVLGGDLISGGIHLELAKTDELSPLPAVRDVSDHLAHALITIKGHVDCPLDVISIPGNHSRTTLKPESKEAAATSLDMLVSDFLELSLRGQDGIAFYAPPSPDALFSVYGWRVLATHGDRIGSRGGQGFIGPAATLARGLKRIVADYAARGVHLDLTLTCHFHTPLQLEEGIGNGCLCGPSEYSRDGRFRPHPATQLFLVMHPRRRIAQVRWIEVGHPDEGSLYEAPPADRPLRPRYRIKVVSERVA